MKTADKVRILKKHLYETTGVKLTNYLCKKQLDDWEILEDGTCTKKEEILEAEETIQKTEGTIDFFDSEDTRSSEEIEEWNILEELLSENDELSEHDRTVQASFDEHHITVENFMKKYPDYNIWACFRYGDSNDWLLLVSKDKNNWYCFQWVERQSLILKYEADEFNCERQYHLLQQTPPKQQPLLTNQDFSKNIDAQRFNLTEKTPQHIALKDEVLNADMFAQAQQKQIHINAIKCWLTFKGKLPDFHVSQNKFERILSRSFSNYEWELQHRGRKNIFGYVYSRILPELTSFYDNLNTKQLDLFEEAS